MNPRLSRLSVAFGLASFFAIAGSASAQVWIVEQLADAPVDRTGHSAVYDPIGQRMVVFGGTTVHISVPNGSSSSVVANDCWQLSMSGTPTWSALAAAGAPPPRADHSAVFDPVGNRMLVFGGTTESGSPLGELWELSLSGTPAWTQLTPMGPSPSARGNHTAIYDPAGRRMIVFGGRGASGDLGDTWMLDLTGAPTWSPMSSAGAPSARSKHVAVYDPAGERMLVAFGNSADNSVFALGLSGPPEGAWSIAVPGPGWQIVPEVPNPRPEAAAALDPTGNVMALFHGIDNNMPGYPPEASDVWQLRLAEPPPDWQRISSVEAVAGLTAVSIPASRQIVLFGGDDSDWGLSFYRRDSYARTFRYTEFDESAAAPTTPSDASFSLEGALPNPASGGLTVGYTLPDFSPARLELWDVTGRRVLERSLDSGPGHHRVRIGAPGRIAPGVYLMRLDQGRETRVRRTTIVH